MDQILLSRKHISEPFPSLPATPTHTSWSGLDQHPWLVLYFVIVETKVGAVLKALRDLGDLTIKNTDLLSDKATTLLIPFQVFR